jgi:succinate dehydrogenase hydrophobic anchor subunit
MITLEGIIRHVLPNTMNLKLIVADALYFFKSNLVQIGSLCLPWLLVVAAVENLIISTGDPSQGLGPLFLLAWVFKLLIYPIYTAALILLMAKRARGQQPDNKELLSSALQIWQPFFIVHVIGAGLSILGLMLFVIPGIYVAVRLSFAEFYLTLENIKPVEAIQKSFQATKPYFFQILLLLALFFIPLGMLNLILADLLSGKEAVLLINITVATTTAFLMLFLEVVKFRVYMSAIRENPV